MERHVITKAAYLMLTIVIFALLLASLPMVGCSLQGLRLLPPLELFAII
jgi:hypothetical protein